MLKHLQSSSGRPARVLILGARGFLSTHLQAWCARNEIDCRPVASVEIDLTQPASAAQLAALIRPDDAIVITSSIQPGQGRDYRALMANLRITETVIGALERAACAQVVCLSSDAVYDAHQIPLDEDSSREATNVYALSHIAREMLLSSELERRNIPLCVLRLTAVYGTGDTHNAYGPNRFVRSALAEGRIVLFGKGEEKRSHVYVDDAVELIGRTLRQRSQGTLNVAVRRAASYREVAAEVIRLAGRPVEITYAERTVPVVHRPYKPTQVFRFLYNLGRPIGPVVHRTFVNSALFAAFPDFRFTPLENGLSSFVAAERNGMPARAGKQVLVGSS
jgi:nucleoside-diphosphate-sugar epimerase